MEKKKNQYIKPSVDLLEVNTQGIISASPQSIVIETTDDGNEVSGDGSDACAASYRSKLCDN